MHLLCTHNNNGTVCTYCVLITTTVLYAPTVYYNNNGTVRTYCVLITTTVLYAPTVYS